MVLMARRQKSECECWQGQTKALVWAWQIIVADRWLEMWRPSALHSRRVRQSGVATTSVDVLICWRWILLDQPNAALLNRLNPVL
jgi:hypothetical protein